MKKNVGNIDRTIRITVAVIIAVLFITKTVVLSSIPGAILAVAGGIFLFTGLTSWCAIYQLVGLSTCPVGETKTE